MWWSRVSKWPSLKKKNNSLEYSALIKSNFWRMEINGGNMENYV